jgi:hypothetical protein
VACGADAQPTAPPRHVWCWPAEAAAVVERLGQTHVRQIMPGGEQQRAEQRRRRPARLAFGGCRDTGKQLVQFGSIQQHRNLIQRRAAGSRRSTTPKLLLTYLTPRHGCSDLLASVSNHRAPRRPCFLRAFVPSWLNLSFGPASAARSRDVSQDRPINKP